MFVRGKRQVVQVALWGLLLYGAFVGTAESKKKVAKPAPAPVAEDMAVEGIAGQTRCARL